MSAPKRTRIATTWLSPRKAPDPPTSFKHKVQHYPGATGAFNALTTKGLDEGLLWRHLWALAHLAKSGEQKANPWYALPGLPSHTLRRLPARVRDWAREIETVERAFQSSNAYRITVQVLPLFLAEAIPGSSVDLRIGGEVIREVGTAKRLARQPAARTSMWSSDRRPLLRFEQANFF